MTTETLLCILIGLLIGKAIAPLFYHLLEPVAEAVFDAIDRLAAQLRSRK